MVPVPGLIPFIGALGCFADGRAIQPALRVFTPAKPDGEIDSAAVHVYTVAILPRFLYKWTDGVCCGEIRTYCHSKCFCYDSK